MRSVLFLSCALAALLPSAPVAAQAGSDVLVMRRSVAPAKPENAEALKPVEGADLNGYYWVTSDWLRGEAACTAENQQTRLRGCAFRGEPADEAQCPQPAPEKTRLVEDYRACAHSWQITSVGAWSATCSATTRPVSAECRRQDGTVVADELCSNQPKPTTEDGFNEAGCTYSWAIGEWGGWSSQCSSSATRERQITCVRQDGSTASDSKCTGTKDATVETGGNYSNCEYRWQPGQWQSSAQSCGGTVTQTRTAECKRTDGLAGDPSLCQEPKPALEQQATDFGACTHEWKAGAWGGWDSQCSRSSKRTRDVWCQREDGEHVEGSKCGSGAPSSEETSEILTGCGYAWSAGEWSTTPQCSASAESTRVISCERTDGAKVDDALCAGTARPTDTRTVEDYANCTYGWNAAPATWSSTCSDAATATSVVKCIRGDGTAVEERYCPAETKPATSIVQPNYDGCPADWATTQWSEWSSQCSSSATRSRTVQCVQQRPTTTASVVDGKCATERPGEAETLAIWSGCVAEWDRGSWGWNGVSGAQSSTCSAQPKQSRTVACRKRVAPDGAFAPVDESLCPQPKPDVQLTLSSDYSGCVYEWNPGPWSSWDSTCSATARRTRTTQCLRRDGSNTVVDNSLCNPAQEGAKTSETANIVTDCGGLLKNGTFEQGLADWSTSGTTVDITTDSYAGSSAARLNTGSRVLVQNFTTAAASRMLTISLYCKRTGNTSGIYARIQGYNGTNFDDKQQVLTCNGTGWTENRFTMPITNQTRMEFKITGPGSSSSYATIVDNIVVTQN